MRLLSDAEVEGLATPEVVRAAMREAVIAAWRGEFISPPRTSRELSDRRLTFTCGQVAGEWFGYRSYVAPGSGAEDQVVIVHDEVSGRVRAAAVGRSLGPRRAGGIGAVALEALAPASVEGIAVIGAGTQAWHQLWALPDRFRSVPISVASRSASTRDAFVERAKHELHLDVRACGDPVGAVRGADAVILATSSSTPVLAAADIRRGAFVSTLGPKQAGRAEFGPDLAGDAGLLVCDSPAQIGAYDPPHILAGSPDAARVEHLGAVIAQPPRQLAAIDASRETRVFFNVGLAGTEAWLLNAIVLDLADANFD